MKENKELDNIIAQARQQIDMLLNDNSVPRNVKSALEQAKQVLGGSEEYAVRASTAMYKIEEISNDINLPPYARTVVWNLLSSLESVRE
jgi:hypothetical protein